ncbi:MAG TPA: YhcH/YjgK/YiaL family protein [Paludibacter sp.]|nr:YhcH/YjgK/YiaL family protein [Paludibacter sp.]
MILDTLENAGLYESLHPRFKKAFEFLRGTNLDELPLGKIELDGAALVVNVAEITGKTVDEARMETHNLYIDIQVPLTAAETMGWKAGGKLSQPLGAYNEAKGITFFADKASNLVQVQPKEFAVFFPEDGHQPGIAKGAQKKIIVKVLR